MLEKYLAVYWGKYTLYGKFTIATDGVSVINDKRNVRKEPAVYRMDIPKWRICKG
jgi:hypothetical protein